MTATRREFLKGAAGLAAIVALPLQWLTRAGVKTTEMTEVCFFTEAPLEVALDQKLLNGGGILMPHEAERFIRKLIEFPTLLKGEPLTIEMDRNIHRRTIEVCGHARVPKAKWARYEKEAA